MTRIEKLHNIRKLHSEFKHLTGINLPFNILGIDIIKLDEMIPQQDNKSLRERIQDNYGTRPTEIVNELLSMDLL